MDFIFGLVIGAVVGFVAAYFIFKNNPKTMDKINKVGEVIKGE